MSALRPPARMRQNYGTDELANQEAGSYLVYCDNSGSISASSTGNIVTTFNHTGKIVGIGCAALAGTPTAPGATTNGGQLEAIGNRNAFTVQFTRQNSTSLLTKELLAAALFGMEDGMWWLVRPWRVARGEVLGVNLTNKVSSSALTVHVAYHVLVDQLS